MNVHGNLNYLKFLFHHIDINRKERKKKKRKKKRKALGGSDSALLLNITTVHTDNADLQSRISAYVNLYEKYTEAEYSRTYNK